MKVLYFIPFPVIGGAELQIAYLIKNGPGISHIVAYQYPEVEKFVQSLGVPCHRVYSPASLARTIDGVNPQIIHFYHSHVMYQALRRLPHRPKTYELVHNRLGFEGDSTCYPKICTDYMVCVSDDAAEYCTSKLPAMPTIVIPNGVDTNVFKPFSKAKRDVLVGGFSGRLEPGDGKGIPQLIDAIKDLPCKFELVGKDYGAYEKNIKERGITNISVLPHTANIADAYRRWDFFVSRSPAEGFGLSIGEALACGLPSVVYNCGGICRYLKHGVHALIANNDDEFRSYLSQMISGEVRLSPTSADFSAATMAKRYHEFYDRLLGRSQQGVILKPTRLAASRVAPAGRTIDRLAVTAEDWHGVRRALAPVTDRYSSPAQAVSDIRSLRPKVVVFGCYMPSWEKVLLEARKQGCKTVLTWHASYILNEFDHINREWLWHAHSACKKKLFDFVSTPHKGLAETWTHFGIQTDYQPNVLDVDLKPRAPLPGINIGILGSGQPWKNMDCQIVAANMVPGATVHIQKLVHAQAVDILGCKYVRHAHINSDDAYYDLVGGMTVNMVVSLSEVYSYLAAESLMMGVPVLTTSITPILRGDSRLTEAMCCDRFEDPEELAHWLKCIIRRKEELAPICMKHIADTNKDNKRLSSEVVERWMCANK